MVRVSAVSLICGLVVNLQVRAFRTSSPRSEVKSPSRSMVDLTPKIEAQITVRKVDAPPISKPESKPNHVSSRKRWGIDNMYQEEYLENEYWFDSRIHTLGNSGFFGACHAAVAALATKVIDVTSYQGVAIRHELAESLSRNMKKDKIRVVDLCCGVGISTRALRDAFPNAEAVFGVDTSPEMVAMAEFLTEHTNQLAWTKPLVSRFDSIKVSTGITILKEQHRNLKKAVKFLQRNAEETTLPGRSFDLVTVMYALHEAPKQGREKIIKEAKRLLLPGGTLAVLDISTDYKPSETMLQGEPYVIEYQKNIQRELQNAPGFRFSGYTSAVPGRVGMWILTRA